MDNLEEIKEKDDDDEDETNKFRLYKYRFMICFTYYIADLSNTILSGTFASIASMVSTMYDKSPIVVNLISVVFLIVLPFITPFANFLIDKYGISLPLKIGIGFTILAAFARTFINDYFESTILGSFLAAIGGPMIYNSKGYLGPYWFKPH